MSGDDDELGFGDSFEILLREVSRTPTVSVRAEGSVVASRYRLERPIGEGGMGVVWSATDETSSRRVAIKFMTARATQSPELRRRFLREASTRLEHPNIVRVHEMVEEGDDDVMMVMDLLEGETLAERLARDRVLSVQRTAAVMRPVIDAVDYAHRCGVVHRDLKPANVFLAGPVDRPIPKVLDFGLMKVLPGPDGKALPPSIVSGEALGTLSYMALEQARGDPDVDERADVWAVGAILYECLSGRRAIVKRPTVAETLNLLRDGPPPLAAVTPAVPEDLSAAIAAMLVGDRSRRPRELTDIAMVLGRHAARG